VDTTTSVSLPAYGFAPLSSDDVARTESNPETQIQRYCIHKLVVSVSLPLFQTKILITNTTFTAKETQLQMELPNWKPKKLFKEDKMKNKKC
jgi:hypothetical protein